MDFINVSTVVFSELIGHTIDGVFINSDKDVIEFMTSDDKLFTYLAEGDCCSSSWIEHVNGLAALIGHKVINVVERDMPEAVDDEKYDCLQFYGWTLETAAGRFDIEMRNSSNGYYGGYITLLDGVGRNTQIIRDENETGLIEEDF